MAEELKGKGDWMPLTPAKSEFNSTVKSGLNHDVGSVENPQFSQIWGKLGESEKESGNGDCEFGNAKSVCFERENEPAQQCDGSASNIGELHGKFECKIGGISDDRPLQEVPNHSSHCEFGADSKNASSTPKNQTPKKRSRDRVVSNKKPRKRMRMKRHRPKVFDESKPMKPSTPKPRTPKPRTPKRAKCVRKDKPKASVDPSKDVDQEAVASKDVDQEAVASRDLDQEAVASKDVDQEALGGYKKNSCRQKLDFNKENCIMNQNSMMVCDGIKNEPKVEPNLQSGNRFMRVYQRTFRPNECLKNSRKLGPNCPNICKKTRMRRQRATVFDKFITLVSMTPTTRKQRRAAKNDAMKLCPMVKDRMMNSRISSRRQKSLSVCVSVEKKTRETVKCPTSQKTREATRCPTSQICTLSLTWMVKLKRKRSKTSIRRRDFSSLVIDLSKSQVSETFPLETSGIRIQGTGNEKIAAYVEDQGEGKMAACVEVQDGLRHLKTNKMMERHELSQDNAVSCSGRPTEFGDCELVVETDFPEHICQPQEGIMEHSLESETVTPYLVRTHHPHHEQMNVFSIREDDEFTKALVDFAIQRMERLQLDDGFNQQRMERLQLDDGFNQLVVQDQKARALVLSKGRFDPSKGCKSLPKVDLDAETMRVWNLLIENDGSENTEQEDDDKAKYWKEQREIFRGRLDSFSARMHIIQGDRRFSPWKGSVVDSVVGVFLTQNVSDHLSSSAFMSLAARFPPPSVSEPNCCDGRSDCVIHETQQLIIAETPSDKCEELLMEKYPFVSPNNQVGDEPKNGNEKSSQTKSTLGIKKGKVTDKQEQKINWDDLRSKYSHGRSRDRTEHTTDSIDWEAVRQATVGELAKVIMDRGMNNMLAGRIKGFLDRVVRDHGSLDLEWLRDIPPDKAKEYLLSIPGLGLKSTECVRLLTLHHHAFPVDTNVGRILVRLGWVPLQPLPNDVQIHHLNSYPPLDTIQKYVWPRLCILPQPTLYEYHCQLITFGKVFCTKRRPNCNACPMRGECRHYASAVASSRPRLGGPQGENMTTGYPVASGQGPMLHRNPLMLSHSDGDFSEARNNSRNSEPIVEIPASPEPVCTEILERDIEDFGYESEDEITTIKLNEKTSVLGGDDAMSKALATLSPEAASIPRPKLKYVARLRTEHRVYEIPDSHPLLAGLEKREPDDHCPYLLAIWITDATTSSSQDSSKMCTQESTPCDMDTCCLGETLQHQNDQIVRGTILIPCRTANRGTFPLNGTYFQVNEVFADHESSLHPIAVPREWIWNLRRRSLYCGTSVTSISRGLSLEEIVCFFRQGFICIRGIDRETRAPRPLNSRFHFCKTRQVDKE